MKKVPLWGWISMPLLIIVVPLFKVIFFIATLPLVFVLIAFLCTCEIMKWESPEWATGLMNYLMFGFR